MVQNTTAMVFRKLSKNPNSTLQETLTCTEMIQYKVDVLCSFWTTCDLLLRSTKTFHATITQVTFTSARYTSEGEKPFMICGVKALRCEILPKLISKWLLICFTNIFYAYLSILSDFNSCIPSDSCILH